MSSKFIVKNTGVSPSYLSETREVFEQVEYLKPRQYSNNSRYTTLRRIQDKDTGIIHHENWTQKFVDETSGDQFYTVTIREENRLDIISNDFYSTSRYWWVIALANYLMDPFDVPVGTKLRIPPIMSLYNDGGVLNG